MTRCFSPIVVLIIMDVFLQKMRISRKDASLIIEEAWKAIASPTMAEYIKFLYKTVRKFHGIAGVVTQELNDVIDSPIVKEAIINNSDVKILLRPVEVQDRYNDIAAILRTDTYSETADIHSQRPNNKEGRNYFKEVWICRGQNPMSMASRSRRNVTGPTPPSGPIEKEALKNIPPAITAPCREAITRIEADRKESRNIANILILPVRSTNNRK